MKYKHFVTIGHLDHGKSSIIGRILWDMGKVGDGMKSRLIEIGGAEGRQFAYVLDQKKEEQGRGITIDVGHNKLLVDGYSFAFSDAPGHEVFLDKAYQGIEESDAAILVIAADEGIQDQARRHLEHARKIGIKDFIVCVNKMDKVVYEEKAFMGVASQAQELVGDGVSSFIIPTSALEGDNISQAPEKMPWYDGPSLVDCMKESNPRENSLEELIRHTEEIIQKTVDTFKNPMMTWAGGKDSTAALAIARNMFGGKVPFKVMFIDTTYKFQETYDYINRYAKEWGLDFMVAKNKEALENGVNPWNTEHFKYCNELKTKPLKRAIEENEFDAVFTGIRWDEHGIRGKEQYFSKREDPPHTRVHPILHWSEREIWEYLKGHKVEYNPLYDKEEHNGLVYRSIGCWPFTKPVPRDEPEERAGREVDKERLMEDLRALGYM